jgi:hypothetical protein
MKSQPTAIALVVNFVLDVGVRNQLIARDAYLSGAVASFDSLRHASRQLTALDALSNVQPKRGISQL